MIVGYFEDTQPDEGPISDQFVNYRPVASGRPTELPASSTLRPPPFGQRQMQSDTWHP